MNGPELLNLVRQYGTERECVGGFTPDRGTLQREKAQEALDAANALLASIAALVAQQLAPVRDGRMTWWQHYCGRVSTYPESKKPTRCPSCGTLSPWRPLLVEPWSGEVSA